MAAAEEVLDIMTDMMGNWHDGKIKQHKQRWNWTMIFVVEQFYSCMLNYTDRRRAAANAESAVTYKFAYIVKIAYLCVSARLFLK